MRIALKTTMAVLVLLGLQAIVAYSSGPAPDLSGDYTREVATDNDPHFYFSVKQTGSHAEIGFQGILHGGRGRELEGSGNGTVSSSGVLAFRFQDAHGNSGSGTFKRVGARFICSMEPVEVKEPGVVPFYGEFYLTRDRGRKYN
jgi:hypothetical protein